MDKVSEHGTHFNSSYDLYITEVLPGNRYRTNKVNLVIPFQPIDDSVIIKHK